MSNTNGYGTVGAHSADGHATNPASSDEETHHLLGKDSRQSFVSRTRKHMNINVTTRWGDLVLLLCYVITGLLDSSAVFIWGSFVSMQTGNTVYLGLGLVEPAAGTRWITSGTSIGSFCLGSFCFSRFHRYFSPRRRWVLIASFGFQMLLVGASAVIVTMEDKNAGKALRWDIVVPLALVAFQSSGQAVISRALQYNSLTSVVLTSIYCDLFSDPNLVTKGLTQNVERNRRIAAPICLLIGAILGGLWAHSPIGLAGALWTATALKALVIFAWIGWPGEPEAEQD